MKPIHLLYGLSLLAVAPAGHAAPAAPAASAGPAVPAGDYALDKPHASLGFRIDHLGFSHYTARFTRFDAHLHLDPAHPSASSVTAEVDTRSLALNAPPPGFTDQIEGPQWLDAGKYPVMRFRSTRVTPTGPNTARIAGELTLRGVTRPVVLEAKFNGGYPGMAMDPHARVGFSAQGALSRSQFGMSLGLPPPGTTMGVGDRVEILIEAEFTGPAWRPAGRRG